MIIIAFIYDYRYYLKIGIPRTPGIDDLSGACPRGTRSVCTDRRPPIAGYEERAARYRENISPKPLPPPPNTNAAARRQDPNAGCSEEKRSRLFAQRL